MNPGLVKDRTRGRWLDVLGTLAPELHPAIEHFPRHVPCPVHGGKDGFRLFNDAPETGGGICNTCGPKPEGSRLLAWIRGWDVSQAEAAVAALVGLADSSVVPFPSPFPDLTPPSRPARNRVDNIRRARQRAWMDRVWAEARLLAEVPKALAYLDARGVLPPDPSAVRDLRAHPGLEHRDTQGNRSGPWPALVALVRNPKGRPVGTHITWLDPNRPGKKAPVQPPRKLFAAYQGATRGGAVHLFPPADGLAVAEGVETALAVHALTGRPAWSALSAGGLERLVLPPEVGDVLVCPDHDVSGVGERAGNRLAARLMSESRQVRIAVPPEPGDWADVAAEIAREAPEEVAP